MILIAKRIIVFIAFSGFVLFAIPIFIGWGGNGIRKCQKWIDNEMNQL